MGLSALIATTLVASSLFFGNDFGSDRREALYTNSKGTEVIDVFQSKVCHSYKGNHAEWLLKTVPHTIMKLSPVLFELLREKCESITYEFEDDYYSDSSSEEKSFNSSSESESSGNGGDQMKLKEYLETPGFPLIFPGTLWCGAGDTSKIPEDLGLYVETDKCCREHDQCPDNIPANECRHGLCNESSFTVSHCDCDETFYKCLKKDKSLSAPASYKIAHLYFNVLKPLCFEKSNPVSCTKRSIIGTCAKYKYDYKKPAKWQFVHPKPYRKLLKKVFDFTTSPFKSADRLRKDMKIPIPFELIGSNEE